MNMRELFYISKHYKNKAVAPWLSDAYFDKYCGTCTVHLKYHSITDKNEP